MYSNRNNYRVFIESFLLLHARWLRFLLVLLVQRLQHTIVLLAIITHLSSTNKISDNIPIRTTARMTCEAAITRNVSTFVISPNSPAATLFSPYYQLPILF